MCGEHSHDIPKTEAPPAQASSCGGHGPAVTATDDSVAECPVMRGSYIAKADAEAQGLVRDYDGQRYYLCCAACGPLFDANPEKYVSAL